MERQNTELDPDFVDIIIQSISVLSNVATLASTWVMLRGQLPTGVVDNDPQLDSVRQQLRILRRA